MKRVLIFSAICAAIFVTGYPAAKTSANEAGSEQLDRYYAPKVSIGQFTSSLAGTGRHVLDCAISLELVEQEDASSLMQSPKWMSRIRSEIFSLIKSRSYDDLTSAEGVSQLAGDIKHSLNRMLPDAGGENPVVNVLFDSFIVQ